VNSHLKELNESYIQHLRKAMYFSCCLLAGSACACIHALVPCVMTKTTSRLINHMRERLDE